MDGSWRLVMNLNDGSGGGDAARPAHSPTQRLGGSAIVRLSNGNLIPCALKKGTYSGNSGHSRVRLSGTGANLTVSATQSDAAISALTGRVFGQRIHAVFFSPIDPITAPIGGGGGATGRLSGSRFGCGQWSFGISGEDLSSTRMESSFQYDAFSRVARQYGTLTAVNTGHAYSYDARYSYDFTGCISSVTLTVSGGVLRPSSQTITF